MDIKEYIEEFSEYCLELSGMPLASAPPIDEIKAEVSFQVEEYYRIVGKYPNSFNLTLLANYLLIYTLKDKDVDKVTNTDRPIMSESQLKRRNKKQHSMSEDGMDFLNSKFNRRLDTLSKKVTKELAD